MVTGDFLSQATTTQEQTDFTLLNSTLPMEQKYGPIGLFLEAALLELGPQLLTTTSPVVEYPKTEMATLF